MEGVISDLVSRFEQGRVSRRELVRTLATLVAAGGGAASASARQQTPFTSTRIDHISIQVTDLPRSIAFYQEVFGHCARCSMYGTISRVGNVIPTQATIG